jgi:hypothetical protein
MDLLTEHYISIDKWNPLFPDKTTFLLTHLHSDHVNIPTQFEFVIYTSQVVEAIWEEKPPCVHASLIPGRWYKTFTSQIPFRVLQLNHTVESIGFLFPTLSILYLGDSLDMPPDIDHRQSLHVIYDGIFEHIRMRTPTPDQSCQLIHTILGTYCQKLKLVHHGILSFLQTCGAQFSLHDTISPMIKEIVILLNMYRASSPFMLVGSAYKGECIVPSSNWFFTKGKHVADIEDVASDGLYHRVFCTLHATGEHVQEWRTRFTHCFFSTIPHNRRLSRAQ